MNNEQQQSENTRGASNIRVALILGAIALLAALSPLMMMRNMAS